ncbi:isoprenyl transferase [bacterium]|nr:isoprenyl transferase [bacterium]
MATLLHNRELEAETDENLRARLDPARRPRHVAVIMDGNGRWARQRGLPRIEGHRAGIKSVREIVTTARELEIPFLTLYAFSVENWKRPASEVSALMLLLRNYLWREKKTLLDNGIRLNTIGRVRDLPEPVYRSLEKVIEATAGGRHMTLSVALSYGGRADLLDAVNALVEQARQGTLPPGEITEQRLAAHLSTRGLPDPDLLIRTSGEQRVSNFLLWEIAYAELFITPVLWPDFRRRHLYQALLDYQARERHFGGIGEQRT